MATLPRRPVLPASGVTAPRCYKRIDSLPGQCCKTSRCLPTNPTYSESAICSSSLGLAAEIGAMPMGLDTPIGELGTGLSGGQVQRLLLARALYAKPQYLFLDECTSHLDPGAAAQVQALIGALSMTRLVISHDPAFISQADRALELSRGRLIAREPAPTVVSSGRAPSELD